MDRVARFAERRARFRELHRSGFFVLPNPWDAGSARMLEQLGFAAIATTSAGHAFSLGRPDGGVFVDEAIAHVETLSNATTLPLNVDFEDGLAETPSGVAANVARCIEAGAAGVSIEDATGRLDVPLYPLDAALERLRATRDAIDRSGADVMLIARSECYLTGHPAPLDEAIRRLVAFAEDGADCLFAPGVAEASDIAAIVAAVAPKPVNVVLRPGLPSLDELRQLGVRRLSTGAALSRAAWRGFLDAAAALQSGRIDWVDMVTPSKLLNDRFAAPR